MPSKSAHKRMLKRKGAQLLTATTARQTNRDATQEMCDDMAKTRASFGLSFSLDNPIESTMVKTRRESGVKHTKQRFALA